MPQLRLGQEEIYFPQHEGMTGARWSQDGKFIATWGESPLVRIWHDHDGSLALELDHSSLMFELPNGKLPDMFSKLSVVGVDFSADVRYVITYAQPNDRRYDFFRSTWTADTGELVYSYYWGTTSFYMSDERFLVEHRVVQESRILATWYRDAMSFVDISPVSDSVGETLTTIDFGEFDTFWKVLWNENSSEALLKLRTDGI